MKKKILALTVLFTMAFTGLCMAQEAMRERVMIFTNKHDEEIAEIDYYLQRGGIVKMMNPVQKNGDTVYCYVVIQYPVSVPDYVKPKKK